MYNMFAHLAENYLSCEISSILKLSLQKLYFIVLLPSLFNYEKVLAILVLHFYIIKIFIINMIFVIPLIFSA